MSRGQDVQHIIARHAGRALLRTTGLDQDQIGVVLTLIAAFLIAALLIVLMPDNPRLDGWTFDPWSM